MSKFRKLELYRSSFWQEVIEQLSKGCIHFKSTRVDNGNVALSSTEKLNNNQQFDQNVWIRMTKCFQTRKNKKSLDFVP